MNTPVSFEIAKLLKDKRFNQGFGNGQKFYYPPTKELTENHRGDNYPAPTIADVVMWLYEKHGIWIVVWKNLDTNFKFYFEIDTPDSHTGDLSLGLFNSPIEAYSAVIEYTLKNLI